MGGFCGNKVRLHWTRKWGISPPLGSAPRKSRALCDNLPLAPGEPLPRGKISAVAAGLAESRAEPTERPRIPSAEVQKGPDASVGARGEAEQLKGGENDDDEKSATLSRA